MSKLPEPRAIEAALGKTTRRLSDEMLEPGDTPPDWSEFEWRTAMAVCAMQGISVLLAHRLSWTGPALWQTFLAQQCQQGVLRELRIDALRERLDNAARHAGIAMLGLKGSALRRLGLHAAGERPMGDIDLLVHDADLPAATALISGLGYSAGPPHWRHVVFKPIDAPTAVHLGEHADNPIRIELHTRVMERLLFDPVEITGRLWPSDPGPGLQPYASNAALMLHLLLHAAGNISSQSLRLVQLVDIARLSADWQAARWAELLANAGDGPPWWALPPLRLAARHQRLSLPPRMLEPLERACPRRLVRAARSASIEDVSYVQAQVRAFPGIEWSRSPAEAWRLVRGRVLPSAETRRLRRPGAVDHPASLATSWSTLSQTQRALRWLVARPLRQFAVHALQLALDYEAR